MQGDLSSFCCLNPDCPDHGKRWQGNLTVCGYYGKAKRYRLLYCRTCKARFSERKGTPLFRSVLPQEKAIELIEHIADRTSVQATAQLTGVHRNTVTRYRRLLKKNVR
jgi:LacI family transcriptional regulator